jgi:hypothetical protein
VALAVQDDRRRADDAGPEEGGHLEVPNAPARGSGGLDASEAANLSDRNHVLSLRYRPLAVQEASSRWSAAWISNCSWSTSKGALAL